MTALHRIPACPFLLLALACALPLASTGCAQRACFFWTEAEGECPSQNEAIDFFTNSNCDSPIESVDSEAEFDGEMCCYDVTERATEEIMCSPPVPDSKPPGPGGGVPPPPTCLTCSSFVGSAFMGAPPDKLCQTSLAIFDTLQSCLCAGPCQSACNGSFCAQASASTACFDCATDSAVGCGSEFGACVNDL
jgi:hypothetical protein